MKELLWILAEVEEKAFIPKRCDWRGIKETIQKKIVEKKGETRFMQNKGRVY